MVWPKAEPRGQPHITATGAIRRLHPCSCFNEWAIDKQVVVQHGLQANPKRRLMVVGLFETGSV
jgi:hypothetical protein